MAAVLLARERGWQVAVRSGGHSWAQWSVRDRRARHRPRRHARARVRRRHRHRRPRRPAVQGGAELAPYLEARGRFFPGGHCPTVGIGGFLLQGGQGWNARGWGWAAEYVEAVDVVTATGELVRASATENADLYWAARGAGPGFFGVVTRFHLRTLPRPGPPRADRAGLRPRRLRRGDDLAARDPRVGRRHRRDRRADQDRPDARAEPGAARHRPRAGGLGRRGGRRPGAVPDLTGPRPRAVRARRRARPRSTSSASGSCTTTRRATAGRSTTPGSPGPASAVVPAMRRAYTTLPNDKAFTIWFSMAPLRALPDMAFSLQSEIYLASYVAWESPEDDERCVSWLLRDGRPGARDRRPVPRRLRPLAPPGAVPVGRELPAPAGDPRRS